ncbi:hypothetical protein FPV67DRAFT_1421605 [Lyophyllum atratum]|nr:hypothetical protein FPV67DRAFT_1421605 [Lyophyllum atratum]
MANAEIQVYGSFPRIVALGADLNVDADNWHWVHCLTLPLKALDVLQFSRRPYKWIRYVIGIVVGAEGDLSSSSDSLNIPDYNAGLPTESGALYYHTSNDAKQKMFPVDPNINSGRTNLTSSVATTGRAQFRSDTAARDGNRCVLTGIRDVFCDAVHLLAHSKGDTYISAYTQRRSGDPASGDLVQDIDSVRNGLFLNKFTHVGVGEHVAFLPTPNFAMDTSDVDPTAPAGEKRCTAHLFEPGDRSFFGGLGAPPFSSPLRISDTPDWPPAILFDAVYASTVFHHFGTQTLKDVVIATWIDTFYSGGVMDQAHAEHNSITDAQALAKQRTQKQGQERQARHNARAGPDTFDMLLALPYILVPRNELQAMFRETQEKAAAEEQRRVQEKVDTWNRQDITS